MKNKILLIIAILCMLVPFVFAGLSVSAEQYVFEDDFLDFSTVYNCAFTDLIGETDVSTGQYVWTGSPQFTLHYSNFSSNVYPGTYSKPGYFPDDVDMELGMVYHDTSFTRTVNAGYYFTSSNDYVSVSNADNLNHLFVVILSYYGLPRVELESLSVSDVANQFTINGLPLYLYVDDGIGVYEAEINWEVLDSGSDTGRWVVSTPDVYADYGYGFSARFPSMQRAGEYPESDPFVLDNKFFMITYSFGNQSLDFGGSYYSSGGRVIAMYDIYVTSADYTNGYEAGFTEGRLQGYQQGLTAGIQQANSTVNTESASYQAGVEYANSTVNTESASFWAGFQQANSTVNTNSASYLAGLYKGREQAGDLTFMSLIGAVLDAPIRAFFGFTDSDGVQHPGLFTLEILGFDMSAVILSIFTLCVIIVIIRMCLGGGK